MKEKFTVASFNEEQTGETGTRKCEIYFIDDENYCDTNQRYYQMSELELYDALERETDVVEKNIIRKITDEKKSGVKNCKVSFDGWSESSEYDRKNITRKIDENFELWNSCTLNEGSVDKIERNSSVLSHGTEHIYFTNMTYENIYNSLCNPQYSPSLGEIAINTKYFMVLDCIYNLQRKSINITDVYFKKGHQNQMMNLTAGDNILMQKSFNKMFSFVYQDEKLKFVTKDIEASIYKFQKDFCQHLTNNTISNLSINLKEFGVSDKISDVSFVDAIKTKLRSDRAYTSSSVVTSLQGMKNTFNGKIEILNRDNVRLRNKRLSETASINTTTTETETKDIPYFRKLTDDKIKKYMNGITDAKNNRTNVKQLTLLNTSNSTFANEANTAISTEVSETNIQLLKIKNDLIKRINDNFIFKNQEKVSFYDTDHSISSTNDMTNLIKTKSPVFSVERSSTNPIGDIPFENGMYFVEIAGNLKLEKGYYKFFIENIPEIEKEAIDVFLTFKNESGNTVYTKVAYKYGYNDKRYPTTKYILDNREIDVGERTFYYETPTDISPFKVEFEYNSGERSKYTKGFKIYGTNDVFAKNDIHHTAWNLIGTHKNINYQPQKNTYKYETEIYDKNNQGVDDLYVWYKFNDNYDDSSGNFNSCTPTMRMDFNNSDKKTGTHSLYFGGPSADLNYLFVPPTNFSKFKGFTVCTWVKFTSRTHYTRIIDFGLGNANCNIIMSRWGHSNKIILHLFHGGSSYHMRTINDVIPDVAKPDWIHVAWTIDGTNKQWNFYVNGVRQEMYQFGLEIDGRIWFQDTYYATCYIGRSHWELNDPDFKGFMDDFRIYKIALSSERIQSIVNGNDNPETKLMKIKKYPDIRIAGNSSNDNTFEKFGYKIMSSTNWGAWRTNHMFNGIQSHDSGGERQGGGSHHALWMYHMHNGMYAHNTNYIKSDYKGDWTLLKMPKGGIYLYNIRIWARWRLLMRAPGDYKIYACNYNNSIDVKRQSWVELLHETDAQYNEYLHVSKSIMCETKYDTYAICVRRLYMPHEASYVLNIDELEIFGAEDVNEYRRNQSKYRYYAIDVEKDNGEKHRKPKLYIHGPSIASYTSKNYFNIPDRNNGYYGIYIRCARNMAFFNKMRNLNIKYKYYIPTSSESIPFLNIDSTYTDTAYTVFLRNSVYSMSSYENESQQEAEGIYNIVQYIKTSIAIKEIDKVFPEFSASGEASVDPGITNSSFYIHCPTLPTYSEKAMGGVQFSYTAIPAGNSSSLGIVETTDINLDNENNINIVIEELTRFRNIELSNFDCMINQDEYARQQQYLRQRNEFSALMNSNKEYQENMREIENYNKNITYVENLITTIISESTKNINLAQCKTEMQSVQLRGDLFNKYISYITNHSEKESIFIEMDTTGII